MNKDKLNILWTNADAITSKLMVMMYGGNAVTKGWWKEVDIIIWGATAKLAAEDEEIQSCIKACQAGGTHFIACEACAKELGAYEKLIELGIEVKYMGQPLTEIIKGDEHLITI